MRIGIFGGTFDPPHLGHLSALKSAISELKLDKVLVVPTFIPPHKLDKKEITSSDERLEMTKLCFSDLENVTVWDGEIVRGGNSYTIDTLMQIKADYPMDELVLLTGTDMFLSLESWRCYEDLFKLVTCGVFIRNKGEEQMVSAYSMCFSSSYGAKTELVHNLPVEVSSSDIRMMLPEGNGREYLTDKVYGYIIKNGLFNVKMDYDWLRVTAYGMLKDNRIAHVAGCEAEAVRLARRWGCDENMAREAAILHDITKKCDLQKHLKLCSKYDIPVDDLEYSELKLLHAKTGAYLAKDLFNISDDVFNAILWHTTGRVDMSLLEKVIYLADYIEANRDFDGVEALREMSYIDIDNAMMMGLEMSIMDMVHHGIIPHQRSADALEFLKKAKVKPTVLDNANIIMS